MGLNFTQSSTNSRKCETNSTAAAQTLDPSTISEYLQGLYSHHCRQEEALTPDTNEFPVSCSQVLCKISRKTPKKTMLLWCVTRASWHLLKAQWWPHQISFQVSNSWQRHLYSEKFTQQPHQIQVTNIFIQPFLQTQQQHNLTYIKVRILLITFSTVNFSHSLTALRKEQ